MSFSTYEEERGEGIITAGDALDRIGERDFVPLDSQVDLWTCPCFEALYWGPRGIGKTEGFLGDFYQDVGKGFGDRYRGLVLRRTFPELAEVELKAIRLFGRICPRAKFNSGKHYWTFPSGERLEFGYLYDFKDYWRYHGQEFPLLYFDELTTWPDPDAYTAMHSCVRSPIEGLPKKVRATTNPWGPGHTWVKARFIESGEAFEPVETEVGDWEESQGDEIDHILKRYEESGEKRERTHIPGRVEDNFHLMRNDPGYLRTLLEDPNPQRRKAWLLGDWDAVTGDMFGDVWDRRKQVVPAFDIPSNWYVDRAFDWGGSKPFACLWFAVSNGEEIYEPVSGTTTWFPEGSIIVIGELYGTGGNAENWNVGVNWDSYRIANEIRKIDALLGVDPDRGPADGLHDATPDHVQLADHYEEVGVEFFKATKGPGSRVAGWEKIRELLHASKNHDVERPGLYFFPSCAHTIRTIPQMPRSDKNPDDVDTESEDHLADTLRMRVLWEQSRGEVAPL